MHPNKTLSVVNMISFRYSHFNAIVTETFLLALSHVVQCFLGMFCIFNLCFSDICVWCYVYKI